MGLKRACVFKEEAMNNYVEPPKRSMGGITIRPDARVPGGNRKTLSLLVRAVGVVLLDNGQLPVRERR